MSLRALALREEYRSDRDQLAIDLFVPCLSVSRKYDRAVGYFTSAGLMAAARGLEAFAAGDGHMRLVASPVLEEEDVGAILRGLDARRDVIARALLRQLRVALSDEDTGARALLLASLIAEGRLDVRVAVPNDLGPGIFHEKVGIFVDTARDAVAVIGSANETRGGLIDNFEAVEVFKSWGPEGARVDRKRDNFERLWENETSSLEVMAIPDAVRRELVTFANRQPPLLAHTETSTSSERPTAGWGYPPEYELRQYQEDALQAWTDNGYRGVLAMATGAGKTITALWGARRLADSVGAPLSIVILAPLRHLVEQWAREARRWGLQPILCYESSASWVNEARERAELVRARVLDVAVYIATHATASLEAFRGVMASLPAENLLVIGDEMHHLGAEGLSRGMPEHARFRLGLSATPRRWEDEEGTGRLLDYFGDVVFDFGIADAIVAGCLTAYSYLPTLVRLETDELEDYEQVMTKIIVQLEKAPEERDLVLLGRLMKQRTSILNEARGKLEALRTLIDTARPKYALTYCASRKQLAAVMDLMWDRGVVSRQFTGEESGPERLDALRGLENGEIPTLVAIRCLDEGVDVPAAREGYLLASSGNPRQFVQRRGRLLRLSPGKERSVIHDLIVIPDRFGERERDMLRTEVRRLLEFARSAVNGAEAVERLWPTLDRHGLLHELGG